MIFFLKVGFIILIIEGNPHDWNFDLSVKIKHHQTLSLSPAWLTTCSSWPAAAPPWSARSPGRWQWNSSWGLCWWWQQTGQRRAGRRWGRGGRISDWSGQCRHWTICNVEQFWAHSDRTDNSAQTEELKKMRCGKIFIGFALDTFVSLALFAENHFA